MSAPIWIIDDVVVRPGHGPAFLQRYLKEYAPGAASRGMTLVHQMVEPAMWLDDEPNRILLIWSVPDAGAMWVSKHVARMTTDVTAFWEETAPPFIISRKRSITAEASQLEALANV
ncbi:hypothetical protein [Sphingomonas sp. KC8]|uniref:hypothetical protein n=1 Tax=Sphingomonas sp. KC8 TaxID=1030157 RepID=UPI0002489B8E|nr:hypothetical protein [Sphingomonas sp. KC8]ARS26136.1 hypothetical protein KC8_02370 [Sphingomonas sp. KC8]